MSSPYYQRIINTTDQELRRLPAEAWEAMQSANNPPILYRYGVALVRLELDDTETCVTRELTQDRMRHRLARVARWVKSNTDGGEQQLQALRKGLRSKKTPPWLKPSIRRYLKKLAGRLPNQKSR